MVVRNSVILVDRIEYNHAQGLATWDAVLEATEARLRPILLTASAAILGMIPIMSDVFWGPMAYAIAGGLAGATLLTLLFLPALYVIWFRVKPPTHEESDRARGARRAAAAEAAGRGRRPGKRRRRRYPASAALGAIGNPVRITGRDRLDSAATRLSLASSAKSPPIESRPLPEAFDS